MTPGSSLWVKQEDLCLIERGQLILSVSGCHVEMQDWPH